MKAKYIIPAFLLLLVFVSCQKEIDWSTGTPGSSAPLLVKIDSKTTGTSDSTVITYSYDAQGRLIREKTIGVGSGVNLDNELTINRNSSGVITTTVQKSALLLSNGVDSVVTRYYYNSTSSRYTAAAFNLDISGFSVTDSAVFSYDANGRITHDEHYIISSLLPLPLLALKNQYSYSAGGNNLTGHEQLAVSGPGGPLNTVSTQTYTYDSKSNAIPIRNESIILGRTGFYNTNNAANIVFDSPADPSLNFTLDYTYKYNSANKPDSSYSTRNPGGTVVASKYFYQ